MAAGYRNEADQYELMWKDLSHTVKPTNQDVKDNVLGHIFPEADLERKGMRTVYPRQHWEGRGMEDRERRRPAKGCYSAGYCYAKLELNPCGERWEMV